MAKTHSWRVSTEEARRRLANINPRVSVVSKINAPGRAKFSCKCTECGHTWQTTWGILRIGCGCPICGAAKAVADHAKQCKYTTALVRSKLHSINPHIKIIGCYTGSAQPLPCICRKCGYKWSPIWESLQQGCGCPRCFDSKRGMSQKLTIDIVRRRLRSISPSVRIISDTYVNASTKLQCFCTKCKKTWFASWVGLSQGKACGKCTIGSSEEDVRKCLEQLTNMQWPRATPSEVPWLHGLYLDGYCRTFISRMYPNGAAFEFQGPQHYKLCYHNKYSQDVLKVQKRRDWRKRYQCWQHGVRLIRVPYWVKDIHTYLKTRVN